MDYCSARIAIRPLPSNVIQLRFGKIDRLNWVELRPSPVMCLSANRPSHAGAQ
jgi:hypothetical protein